MLRHSDTSLFIRYLRRLHTSGSFRLISFFGILKRVSRRELKFIIEKKEEKKMEKYIEEPESKKR